MWTATMPCPRVAMTSDGIPARRQAPQLTAERENRVGALKAASILWAWAIHFDHQMEAIAQQCNLRNPTSSPKYFTPRSGNPGFTLPKIPALSQVLKSLTSMTQNNI
jgi:hypothetical protein